MRLLLVLSFICCSSLMAKEKGYVSIGAGGLTPHFTTPKKDYCNQWNDTGVIFNRTNYIRAGLGRHSFTYMQGQDSICSDMEGFFYSYHWRRRDWYHLHWTAGFYGNDATEWEENRANTPEGHEPIEPVIWKVEGRRIVPVIALEVGLTLMRTENWAIKMNNILTVFITNHSLAIEYSF